MYVLQYIIIVYAIYICIIVHSDIIVYINSCYSYIGQKGSADNLSQLGTPTSTTAAAGQARGSLLSQLQDAYLETQTDPQAR